MIAETEVKPQGHGIPSEGGKAGGLPDDANPLLLPAVALCCAEASWAKQNADFGIAEDLDWYPPPLREAPCKHRSDTGIIVSARLASSRTACLAFRQTISREWESQAIEGYV